MSIEIRSITEAELDLYIRSATRAFGDEPREGEQDRVRKVLGLARARAAFAGDRLVGTTGSYGFRLAVPGAVDVACAGLTRVTVAAAHRRRGILRSLMADHFADAAENGEALSILWASEVAIYGRFGYGQATENMAVSYDARLAGINAPDQPDELDEIDAPEAEKMLPGLRERHRITRPGLFQRDPLWWELRCFPDHEWQRDGASSNRTVLASRHGEPVGYAIYRQKPNWTDIDLPDGEIRVSEVVGVDDRAVHTLWWYLSNIDLFPHVNAYLQPIDSMVPWLARNSRAVKRVVNDGIHLRVLDVATALTARRYDSPGELTFRVGDDERGDGADTYRLVVAEDGTAECERHDGEPAASVSAKGLGAMYLGGCRPEPLVRNGHLQADGRTVEAIRRMFTWPVAPFCDEGF